MHKPNTEDFSLSADIVKNCEHIEKYFIVGKDLLFSPIGIFATVLLSLTLIPFISGAAITRLIVALFIGFWVGIIGPGLLLGYAIEYLYRFFNSDYKNYKNYKSKLQEYEVWWVRTQVDFWKSLSGRAFEAEMASLFSKLGYKTKLTSAHGDEGVDIVMEKDGQVTIVQCKAHKNAVGPHIIRDLYGTIKHFKARKAILASISGFTKGTIEFSKNKPIELLSLDRIIELQQMLNKN